MNPPAVLRVKGSIESHSFTVTSLSAMNLPIFCAFEYMSVNTLFTQKGIVNCSQVYLSHFLLPTDSAEETTLEIALLYKRVHVKK
jgi:hypothetical protein